MLKTSRTGRRLPGRGRRENGSRVSDALGAELAIAAKHRVNATHVEAMNVIGDVEGRDAV
ncbi:MAG: hypothetical protein ACLT38_09955 [Akkermansia sp.]